MGTLTESMVRLRDEIVTLREKRSLGQAQLARVAAERRASVGAMRLAFSEDRALAHRAWFGPNAAERRSAELQKQRRLADEAKAQALADQERRLLADEARALAQAEQRRKLAEEARVRAKAEQERRLAEEARARAQAEQERRLAEEAAEEAAQEARTLVEAKARIEAEAKAALAQETVAVPLLAEAAPEHNGSARHATSRKHKTSQNKPSQDKALKRHSSK